MHVRKTELSAETHRESVERQSRPPTRIRLTPAARSTDGRFNTLLRDVGFSLGEAKALLASRTQAVDGWRSLAHRKLADLDEQISKAQTAKEAITHALRCPHDDIAACHNFASVIAARLAGQPLEEAHLH